MFLDLMENCFAECDGLAKGLELNGRLGRAGRYLAEQCCIAVYGFAHKI